MTLKLQITEKQSILDELEQFQSILDETFSDDIQLLQERIIMLSSIQSRSGKLVADSKYHNAHCGREEMKLILQGQYQFLSSKAQNKFIDSICEEEMYLVNWSERTNATVTHQIDTIRTLISKAKEELRLNAIFNNQR